MLIVRLHLLHKDTVLLLYGWYSECDNKLMSYAFVDFDGNRTGHVNVLLLAGLRLLTYSRQGGVTCEIPNSEGHPNILGGNSESDVGQGE